MRYWPPVPVQVLAWQSLALAYVAGCVSAVRGDGYWRGVAEAVGLSPPRR